MFGKELRLDPDPELQVRTTSTYAVEGYQSASRMHRAMAGLSMGGMPTGRTIPIIYLEEVETDNE